MKTKMKRAGLGLAVLMTVVVFSSFVNKIQQVKRSEPTGDPETEKWEQYRKVSKFVMKKICNPIAASSGRGYSAKEFSRCPSGYQPEFTTDDVKSADIAYGTVQLYSGCTPKYVCDFKVCVDKEYAMVKSKNSKEYITVEEWLLEQKKQQPQKKDVVKK